ncbi:Leucine-, isoleucine-, valine-, threonine-, and alanine-binding protein [subsurface metagenome]
MKNVNVLILLISIVIFYGCSSNSNKKNDDAEKKVLIIGASLPLTGEGAEYGVPQKNAMELAIDDINNSGGINGLKVKLDAQDDKALPLEAVNITQRFVAKNIIGVVGYPNSGNAIAASKILYENSIPFVPSSPTNPKLTEQGYNNIFRFVPTDDMQGKTGAEFIFNILNVKSIVIIHDNAAYGKGIALQVEKFYKALGGEILSIETIEAGKNDYRTVLHKISEINVDAIFYGGMTEEGAVLIKQAKELNMDISFIFGDGCFSNKLLELSGTDCKNIYISSLTPIWSDLSTTKEFIKKYESKFGEDLQAFAPYGYDAVLTLCEALRQAKSLEKDEIIKTLGKPNFKVNGVTGEISFGDKGQITDRGFYFYRFNSVGQLILMN